MTTLKFQGKELDNNDTGTSMLSEQCKSLLIKHEKATVHMPQHVNLGKLSNIKKSVQLNIQWKKNYQSFWRVVFWRSIVIIR